MTRPVPISDIALWSQAHMSSLAVSDSGSMGLLWCILFAPNEGSLTAAHSAPIRLLAPMVFMLLHVAPKRASQQSSQQASARSTVYCSSSAILHYSEFHGSVQVPSAMLPLLCPHAPAFT